MSYKGARVCGTVEFTVCGKPEAMRYSHYRSCRLGGYHAVIVE
jgi:hypothetical protein